MESTELISALAKVVEAKKATDKAYRTLSKAFFNGTDDALHNAVIELQKSLSLYTTASNYAFMATLNK